jgi:uncharacterized protein YfaS (alpha-2-macroglobulin family)
MVAGASKLSAPFFAEVEVVVPALSRIPKMLRLIALAFSILIGPAVAADQPPADPLGEVAESAHAYAKALLPKADTVYSEAERATLAAAASLLYERKQCAQATELRKLLAGSSDRVGYGDWYGLALAADCAQYWEDAVNASFLALEQARDPNERASAARVLGLSLQGHWRYGDDLALVAFARGDRQRMLAGAPGLGEHIAELERRVEEAGRLRIERSFVQEDSAVPAICLAFSDSMPEPDAQSYGQYLRFEPAFEASFRLAAADEVCADGAEFGTEYRVRALPGLKSESGKVLEAPRNLEIAVGDRAPALWFENGLYVLPRGGGGVPIHSINVGWAKLTLYRIGERNLSQEFVRNRFRTDLHRQEADSIRDRLGEQVWEGSAELSSRRNLPSLTNLDLAPLLEPAAGVYVLTAEPDSKEQEEDAWSPVASQWLVVTDLGLVTYQGADGLTVVARSLQRAEPQAGVRLALYARNNQLLGEAVSDASGRVHFPVDRASNTGGNTPDLVVAFGPGGDFNFLQLGTGAFDLSDRGVGGRALPGPLDAFVYTERGVYRPGERVEITALLRDDRGRAVDGLPLTLRLLRPDGQIGAERLLSSAGAGGYSEGLDISASARTGRWWAQVFVDEDADPVGEAAFLVEAIVPPRLELEVTERPEVPLRPGTDAVFGVQARYLFGAPGADLPVSAEVRVSPDPDPFPAFEGYRFGPVDEPQDSLLLPLAQTRTDEQGRASLSFRVDRLPDVPGPLKTDIHAEVTDVDGRAVATSLSLPLRHQPLLLGIKPPGKAGVIAEGGQAVFEVIALDPDGQPLARSGLSFRLVEEQLDYQWYRDQGAWHYKRQTRDRLLEEGGLDIAAQAPARLGRPLATGSYRLEVRDPASGVLSSARLQVGWQTAAGEIETPDRLRVSTDRPLYAPGATARLQVESPFPGRAELVIATDRVLEVRELTLPDKKGSLEVEVDPAWGAGAYALVTAYRPDRGTVGRGPRRAIGVAWLGIDPAEKRLHITLKAPSQTRPRQPWRVPLTVSGQSAGSPVFVTLAAVDEGVLQLTAYDTPDPLAHYFGQRRLGVDIRDLYGRLIDGRQGLPAQIRSGGGAPAGRQGAPESSIRIVSLFSGVVPLNAEGTAVIPMELPDFNGRLRLMAVAWSSTRVGSVATRVTVRDPVVVTASLPRFLAVGDHSRASLLLSNLDGPEGDYRLSWKASGAVKIGQGPSEAQLALHSGQREALSVPLEASSAGVGHVTVRLQGPDELTLGHRLKLGVREPFLPESRRRLARLGSGESIKLGAGLIEGLRPETLSGVMSVSPDPDLDVPGLLEQLDLYPYGCLEQVTSRAFPLLHLERLSVHWDYRSKTPASRRLTDAVARILDNQLANGAFALWGPGGEEESWLSAYALEFLQRAREGGVTVPDFAWSRGLDWLRRQVAYPEPEDAEQLATQAYALYVLARAGEAHPETARYLLDQVGEDLPSGLAAAQLGGALALMGDLERSARAFALSGHIKRASGLRDYGSPLRDLSGRVLLQAEATGSAQGLAEGVQALAEDMTADPWLSTQEQAWLVRAANAVTGEGRSLHLSLYGVALPERSKSLVLRPAAAGLVSGIELGNQGVEPVWLSQTVIGTPAEAPEPLQAGLSIRRTLHRLSGEPVSSEQLVQGTLLVAVLEGEADKGADGQALAHQLLIVDPLPAGLEIENPSLVHARSASDLDWLGELSETLYAEALDDRFVAAVDLNDTQRTYRVAYLARAVTPGRYHMPAAQVEDMYKPRYRARGESGWLSVTAGD